MPQKRRSQSWAELKQTGNDCFKTGQYGDAISFYNQAIEVLKKSGKEDEVRLTGEVVIRLKSELRPDTFSCYWTKYCHFIVFLTFYWHGRVWAQRMTQHC